MGEDRKLYVVTEWWTNGEAYEDWSEGETPIKVHTSLEDLKKYWKNKINTFELIDIPNTYNIDGYPIYKFAPQEENIIPFECPYGNLPYECNDECRHIHKDYSNFYACEDFEDSQYDNSYTEYKVYLVD